MLIFRTSFRKLLQAKVNEIKDMFSPVGLVWNVYIPHNTDTGYSNSSIISSSIDKIS